MEIPQRHLALTATAIHSGGSLVVGGLTRTITSLDIRPFAAVAFTLHGHLGDGKGMASLTDLSPVADQYDFIVVYPEWL